MASLRYEPQSRFWHSSQLVGESVIIRGGCIPGIDDKRGRKRMMKRIEEFDIKARRWRELKTKGDRHPGLSAVACASSGKHLFAYGGLDGEDLNGVLSQLDLETLEWTQLSPKTSAGPLRKDASGMVHFGDGKLAVVCGYAHPNEPRHPNGGSSDPGSTFIPRNGIPDDGSGWTNEMHIFDLGLRAWLHPVFKGPRPPPCADFALISIDKYRAVLYGGRRGTDHDSKDIYLIDFAAMEITIIKPADKKNPWPKIRLGQQAACCLGFNTNCAQLLITGGRLRQELPLNDMWLFDLMSMTWRKVEIPENIRGQIGRWGHTATTITHSNGLEEVLMIGGCSRMYEVVWEVKKDKDYLRLSGPLSFIFGFIGKEWKLLDVIDSNMDWKTATDTFDIDSEFTLGALYSMEQEGIPVLTELMSNSGKFSSMIGATEIDQQAVMYKWPTLHVPSYDKPTWKKLCLILQFLEKKTLAEAIKSFLENKVPPTQHQKQQRMQLLHEESWRVRYEQLSDQTNTTIQQLEEESEKLKGEVASLQRRNVDAQTSGDMNRTGCTTTDAMLATPPQSSVGDFELRGVDVCGETMFVVTRYAQDFEWEKFGLTLRISEGTLPEGVDQCTVRIKASTTGEYQFPENFDLVSAIFWLRCEPACKFTKSVTMEMEHCVKLGNSAKLCFMKAVCNQVKLPYKFKKIGGRFDNVKRYGNIEMNGFSGTGVFQESTGTQSHIDQREYSAIIFNYVHQRETSYKIDFVVTLNTKAHRTAVKKEYDKKNAELDSDSIFEFESESITIDVPLAGITVDGGWNLVPNTVPTVLKRYVDSYEKGKVIPKCQFSADVDLGAEDNIPPLRHHIKLTGSKSPFSTVKFNINPPVRRRFNKRSASESDAESMDNTMVKRKKGHLPEGHSLDSKLPAIMEATESNVFSPVFNSAVHNELVTAQPPDISKPNMKNLIVFKWKNDKGKIEKFRLKSQIFHKWREIGNLILSWQELEVLNETKPKYCIDVVLHDWLSNPPSEYPATWEGLYELLDDSELSETAADLKLAVENAVTIS